MPEESTGPDRFEIGAKLVSRLSEQELSLTQKIGMQERLLQMSATKNNRYDVELSPEDKRRLQSSLERDKLLLAGERSRGRHSLGSRPQVDVSHESEEYQRILERMKGSQHSLARSKDVTKSEPRFSVQNDSAAVFRMSHKQSDLELSISKNESAIEDKYLSKQPLRATAADSTQ